MPRMTTTSSEREASRMRFDEEERADRLASALPRNGSAEPQPGLIFN